MQGKDRQPNALRIVAIPFLVIWLIVFFVLTIIPAINAFIISFMRYSLHEGISGSDFVGMDSFIWLFQEDRIPVSFANSFVLAVVPVILAIIVAFPIAFVVGGMSAGRLRSATTGLLLLPAFIPDIMLASLIIGIFPNNMVVSDALYSFFVIVISSIKPAAVCAFVGACAAGIYKDRGKNVAFGAISGVLVGIVINVVRFLSSNMELVTLIRRPGIGSIENSLDNLSFLLGLIMLDFSRASAIWVFKTALQFVPAIILVIIVFLCIRTRKNDTINSNTVNTNTFSARAVFGFATALLFLLLLIVPFGILANSPHLTAHSPEVSLPTAIVNTLVITIASGVVFFIFFIMITTWCYAFFGKIAIALILILSPFANNIIGEFVFYLRLGMMNNHLPVILSGIFNLSFVLAVAYLAHLKKLQANSFVEYICALGPYVIAFMGVFLANTWGSSYYQMVYARDSRLFGLGMVKNMQIGWGNSLDFGSLLLLFVLPVLFIGIVTVLIFTFIDNKAQEVTSSTLPGKKIAEAEPKVENVRYCQECGYKNINIGLYCGACGAKQG